MMETHVGQAVQAERGGEDRKQQLVTTRWKRTEDGVMEGHPEIKERGQGALL